MRHASHNDNVVASENITKRRFFLKRSIDRRTTAQRGNNDRKTRQITRIQPIATKIRPKSQRRQGKTDSETTTYMSSEGRHRLYAQPLRGPAHQTGSEVWPSTASKVSANSIRTFRGSITQTAHTSTDASLSASRHTAHGSRRKSVVNLSFPQDVHPRPIAS